VKAPRARPFGSLAATLSHYQMSNLDPTGWSRFLAVCICAAGVDMITMLEEKRSRRAILCGIPAHADTGTEDMQAIIARERAAGVDGLALASGSAVSACGRERRHHPGARGGVHPGVLDWPGTWADRASRHRTPTIPGYRDRLEIRSGEPILKSPGDLS
jgi:hypothetical protein